MTWRVVTFPSLPGLCLFFFPGAQKKTRREMATWRRRPLSPIQSSDLGAWLLSTSVPSVFHFSCPSSYKSTGRLTKSINRHLPKGLAHIRLQSTPKSHLSSSSFSLLTFVFWSKKWNKIKEPCMLASTRSYPGLWRIGLGRMKNGSVFSRRYPRRKE